MAITTEMPLENAIGYIAKGLGDELQKQIKAALMPHAEKVVEEVSKKLCQNLKTNMTSWHNKLDGSMNISLVIDGERHEF